MSTQPACIISDLPSEAWFPSSKLTQENREAIKVCEQCPIRRQCAQDVLDSLDPEMHKKRRQFWAIRYGIWAGVWVNESHNKTDQGLARAKSKLALIVGGYV